MAISRRQFIQSSCALAAISSLNACTWRNEKPKQWLLSPFNQLQQGKQQHYVGAFSQNGEIISRIAMPGPCHQVIAHPNKPGHAVVFAHYPNRFIFEVDFVNSIITNTITIPAKQHISGHGVFSADGQQLFYSSHEPHKGQGQISVLNSANYQLITQYSSGGIAPQQIVQHPTKAQLIIANRGVLTQPKQQAKYQKLNNIAANLSYIDSKSGDIIDSCQLQNQLLSICHIAISDQGKVIAGLQYLGAKSNILPLILSHQAHKQPKYLYARDEIWQQMKQQTTSIAINSQSQVAAICSPAGNLITYWDIKKDLFISKQRMRNCTAVTLVNHNHGFRFAKSSGDGQLQIGPQTPHRLRNIHFNNHLSIINAV